VSRGSREHGGVLGRGAAVVLVMVVLLAGCTGSGDGGNADRVTRTSSTTLVRDTGTGREGCSPATPIDTAQGNELRGTMTAGQLYGIAMGTAIPPKVGDPLKIVWRMTGRGPLRVMVTGPGGRHAPLTFGPDPHPSSTYHRPGDEWGTGFRFDRSGCWRVHLARTDTSGDVWLAIA
jgi:hypothetical protein